MKCVLVIEKGPQKVACGAFRTGTLEPLEYFSYETSDLKEAARPLSADLAKKGLNPAKTLLSIHSSLLSMRMLDIPIAERKKLREVVTLQAEDLFVNGTDGLIVDAMPVVGARAVVVAIDKDELTGQLKALDDAGMTVQWAGPALLSKGLLLRKRSTPEETSALIDDDSITVAKAGEACFFKHLDSIDDLLLSLSALEAEGIKVERFFSAGTKGLATLAGLKADEAGSPDEHTSLLAAAMQVREGLRDSVNFLKWLQDPREEAALLRRVRLSWALVCVLALSWGAYSYFRYQNISAELNSIESDMKKGYAALFPGEKPKNAEYALEVRIKELAREREVISGRVDALNEMLLLTEAARGKSIRVHEMEASGKRVNISSEAASYEEAASFREAASKGALFKKVSILETKPGPNGRVRFTLSAEMEGL